MSQLEMVKLFPFIKQAMVSSELLYTPFIFHSFFMFLIFLTISCLFINWQLITIVSSFFIRMATPSRTNVPTRRCFRVAVLMVSIEFLSNLHKFLHLHKLLRHLLLLRSSGIIVWDILLQQLHHLWQRRFPFPVPSSSLTLATLAVWRKVTNFLSKALPFPLKNL